MNDLNQATQLRLVIGLPVLTLLLVYLRHRHVQVSENVQRKSRNDDREPALEANARALEQRERLDMYKLDANVRQKELASRLRCALLCGPFGSGKTTVLRHLLREVKDHADFQCAALINDFSDVGVDAERVIQDQTTGVAMAVSEGCLCCSVAKETEDVITRGIQAIQRSPEIDCSLVEANGLSEVANSRARLAAISSLESVIGVLDASCDPPSGLTNADLRVYAMTCDLIVLNKSDLVEAEALARAESRLESLGAKKIVVASRGRLALTQVFNLAVFNAESTSVGTTLSERRASTRYSLLPLEGETIQAHAGSTPTVHNLTSSWDTFILESKPISSLACVQDVVYEWWKRGTLKRAKGRVWIKSISVPLEFQYSGRCRLQLTPLMAIGARVTRLVAVSEHQEDLRILKEGFSVKSSDVNRELAKLKRQLSINPTISVCEDPDGSLVRFRLSCQGKFGFDEETLKSRFGVDVNDVNEYLVTRINCDGMPLLAAFDGNDCLITLGSHLRVDDVIPWLERHIEDTINVKFAVVKRYCRCEG